VESCHCCNQVWVLKNSVMIGMICWRRECSCCEFCYRPIK
jgi:hypothetical protein